MVRAFLLGLVLLAMNGCVTAGKNYVYYKVRVKSGDTLAGIAQRFDADWRDIARDNDISDPTELRVGTIVTVRPGPGYQVDGGKNQQAQSKRGLLFGKRGAGSIAGSLQWPASGPISSYYGKRGNRRHEGIDVRANRGSPIVAAAGGRVTFVGWKKGYGKTVVISHESGEFSTVYAHCLELKTHRGFSVKAGDVIATVGRSGNATGYHLHFEVRDRNDIPVDPLLRLGRPDQLLSRADH